MHQKLWKLPQSLLFVGMSCAAAKEFRPMFSDLIQFKWWNTTRITTFTCWNKRAVLEQAHKYGLGFIFTGWVKKRPIFLQAWMRLPIELKLLHTFNITYYSFLSKISSWFIQWFRSYTYFRKAGRRCRWHPNLSIATAFRWHPSLFLRKPCQTENVTDILDQVERYWLHNIAQ